MFAQGLLRHIEFPAQAGMNRYVEPIAAAVSRVPRASGDEPSTSCLLYTSDAADEEDSAALGGRRIIQKKKEQNRCTWERDKTE